MERAVWAEGFERPTGEVDARRLAGWRLADAVRALAEEIAVVSDAPLELLQSVTGHVAAATAAFGAARPATPSDATAWPPGGEAPLVRMGPRMDRNPVTGAANPLAPPLDLRFADGGVVGTATFGAAHEGPPGAVHGGWMAAAFDALLGMAQSTSGRTGLTGTLVVRYRRPTPLFEEIRFEGRLDAVEGRKLMCSGRSYAGEVLTAESEAIFVSIDFAGIPDRVAHGRRPEAAGPGGS